MEPILTERLVLRAFVPSDAEALHREVYADPEVWGPKPLSHAEDSVAMAALMARSPDDSPWAKRAVVLRETGGLVGQVRLGPSPNSFYRWAEEPDPPFNPVEVELSFAFGRRYWGRGYASEASRTMIEHAFETLRLPRLVNGTGSDNARSIALHRRLGFRIFPALPSGDGIVAVLENPLRREGVAPARPVRPEGVGLSFSTEPSEDRERELTERLVAFNRARSPLWEANHDGRFVAEPLHVFALDPHGRLVGGLVGRTHVIRDWLEVGLMWVDEDLRGQGLGRALVERAETDARRRGCRHARLSTSEHQAPNFYERQGYALYGRLDGCPPGETALYYRKDL